MKIGHVLFPSNFFKITDPFDGRSFLMCSHDLFFGTREYKMRVLGQTTTLLPLLWCANAVDVN